MNFKILRHLKTTKALVPAGLLYSNWRVEAPKGPLTPPRRGNERFEIRNKLGLKTTGSRTTNNYQRITVDRFIAHCSHMTDDKYQLLNFE